MVIKVKFIALAAPEEGEDQTYRLKFTKKRGNLMDWYELFNDMKEDFLDDSITESANQQEEVAAE